MQKKILVYTIIGTALVIGIAQSEFYQYKDPQGNVVFTDDLSQIPEDQRPDMTRFESVVPSAPALKAPPSESTTTEPETPDVVTKETPLADRELDALRDWLIEEKKGLDREKAALEATKPDISTQKDRETYNDRVRAINERIEQFKEKLATYNRKIRELE